MKGPRLSSRNRTAPGSRRGVGRAVDGKVLPVSEAPVPTALSEDPFGFVGLTYDDVLLLPGSTDVIPSEASTRLEVLSIAPLLARAIQEVFEDGSVTSLFNGRS